MLTEDGGWKMHTPPRRDTTKCARACVRWTSASSSSKETVVLRFGGTWRPQKESWSRNVTPSSESPSADMSVVGVGRQREAETRGGGVVRTSWRSNTNIDERVLPPARASPPPPALPVCLRALLWPPRCCSAPPRPMWPPFRGDSVRPIHPTGSAPPLALSELPWLSPGPLPRAPVACPRVVCPRLKKGRL